MSIRIVIRFIGASSLIIFLSILWSDWEFNSAWFPIVLMNNVFFSLLLEVYLWMKVENQFFEVKLLFIALFICLSVGSFYSGMFLNRNFLSGRKVIYENEDILIEKGTLYKGSNIQIDYYLLEHVFGKLIVKELEHIQKPKKSVDCEVKFMKHHVFYDECSKKFIP